jgi:putative membrane protein
MRYLLLRLFLNALGLVVAASIVPAIDFDTPWSVLSAAIVVGFVNSLVRPVLFVLTLPLTILSLGLFTLVLNALLLQLVSWLVAGFHVEGFRAALLGAVILSLVSYLGSRFLAGQEAPIDQRKA